MTAIIIPFPKMQNTTYFKRQTLSCSFCHRNKDAIVGNLYGDSSTDTYICSDCVKTCKTLISSEG